MKTSDFLDFYILQAIRYFVASDKESDFNHTKTKLLSDVDFELFGLSQDLSSALQDYIFIASFGEARHANHVLKVSLSCLEGVTSRAIAYEMALEFNPHLTYKTLAALFYYNGWRGTFGGECWGNIANSLDLIYSKHIPAQAFIDYCADLKHNCGLFLNKPIVFDQDYDTDDLLHILDDKRDEQDFCYHACKMQYTGARLYDERFIHYRTSSLARRYMNIYYHINYPFFGNKPQEIYTPVEFGDDIFAIVPNPGAKFCKVCGELLSNLDRENTGGWRLCTDCYNEHAHRELVLDNI